MLKANMKVLNPEKVHISLEMKMSLEDWIAVRQSMTGGGYPATQVMSAITDMVSAVEKHFYWTEPEQGK